MIRRKSDPRIFMALGGLGVFAGGALLYTLYGGLTEQQGKVKALAAQVQAQRDVPAQLEVSKTELEKVRSKLAHLERNVPEFAYIPTMLRELEAVGKASGLKVVGIRPLAKSDAAKAEEAKGVTKPYEEIEIEVRCRGNYGSILKFMNALNAFPKIVGARAVSVEPKPDPLNPKAAPDLEIDARMRTYLFRDPQDAVSPDKTAMAPNGTAQGGNHAG